MDRSKLFYVYNRAKRASKEGKLRPRDVNRALGLLQRRDQSWRSKYHTTLKGCQCPACCYRSGVCKHIVALMIEKRMEV